MHPLSDMRYDPMYKNMVKSYDDKRFKCKGENVNKELTEKQMAAIIEYTYPWTRG